ncbi:MAG: sulfotransferase [Myxococcales bacterium]|nr:sulfotransferase [Myxococcales bacterium]
MAATTPVQKRWSTDQLITGIETQDWLKLLGANGYRVDATYLHRLAWVGAFSLGATALGRLEDARFGRALANIELDPEPLFVIGHWRSGTTHLHNLLGRLPGHTYPTVFQVVFPSCFLTTANVVPKVAAGLMTGTRTYDNVKHGWNEAAEDEIALAKLTGLSPYVAFMFPQHAARYERYVDFVECKREEKDRWKEAFRYFLKKIMLQTDGSRVVVKSCTHTARIRLILEMFPNAKFVHIHRHPYEVFASTLHMRSHTDWENFFHLPEQDVELMRKQQTLALGQRVFERVVEDRRLIPEENFFEVRYSELVGNEMDFVERIFDHLKLPGFERARTPLRRYVKSLAGYRRNRLTLDARSRDEVYDWWRPAFDAFGYDRAHEDLP